MWQLLSSRIVRGFTTVPTLFQWGETALLLGVFALVAVRIGMAGGMLKYSRTKDSVGALLVFVVISLVVPSLFEEIVFRVLLLPHPLEEFSLGWQVVNLIVAVVLFVMSHVLVAWLFVTSARALFHDRTFLILCTVFGLLTSVIYLHTGSIWPCVVMHWVVVVAWKIWFEGWIMAFGPPKK